MTYSPDLGAAPSRLNPAPVAFRGRMPVVRAAPKPKLVKVRTLVDGRVVKQRVTVAEKQALRSERLASKPQYRPRKGYEWKFNVKTGQWYQKKKPSGGFFSKLGKVVSAPFRFAAKGVKAVGRAGFSVLKRAAPLALGVATGNVGAALPLLLPGGGGSSPDFPESAGSGPLMTMPDGTEVHEGTPPVALAGSGILSNPLALGLLAIGGYLFFSRRRS